MHSQHSKIYYVGGLVSLIFLPILFYVSTTEVRKKSKYCGSIEVELAPNSTFHGGGSSEPDSIYAFAGNDEAAQLYNLRHFCETSKIVSRVVLKARLPEKRSYNFFIQVIDILQSNNFMCNIYTRGLEFHYAPEMTFQQIYEPLSAMEELKYIYSELSTQVSSLKSYMWGDPGYTVRILEFADLGPPPLMGYPGTSSFVPRDKIKEDPKSKIYFDTLDLWFVPIISAWLLLLILSVKKSRRNIVASQSLPPITK